MNQFKLFSVVAANRILPLVRVVAVDAVDRFYRLKHLEFRLARLRRGQNAQDWPVRRQGYELSGQIDQERQAIEETYAELCKLGAVVSDPLHGYFHFPTVVDSRATALCWHPDDLTVQYWHYDHEPCQQRRLVPRRWLEGSGSYLGKAL